MFKAGACASMFFHHCRDQGHWPPLNEILCYPARGFRDHFSSWRDEMRESPLGGGSCIIIIGRALRAGLLAELKCLTFKAHVKNILNMISQGLADIQVCAPKLVPFAQHTYCRQHIHPPSRRSGRHATDHLTERRQARDPCGMQLVCLTLQGSLWDIHSIVWCLLVMCFACLCLSYPCGFF
jgi:hypothetical protein